MCQNTLKTLVNLLADDQDLVAVKLPGSDVSKDLLLVEVQTNGKLLDVFRDTYHGKIQPIHDMLAEKVFGFKNEPISFGLMIAPDTCTLEFAFCREFGEYESGLEAVLFKNIDDLLMERLEQHATPLQPVPFVPEPAVTPQPGPLTPKYGVIPVPITPHVLMYGVVRPPYGSPPVTRYAVLGRPRRGLGTDRGVEPGDR